MLLVAASIVALLLANSPLSPAYAAFWNTEVGFSFGSFHLDESLRAWVNEGFMTIFFFVAGLEIKRELVDGELADKRKAALPAIAAAGGMVVPALIYAALNVDGELRGWAIPMATDIAFALGVVALAGSRVPTTVKIFLLTLAIADDIGSIAIVALFYSRDLSLLWLVATAACFAAVLYLRASEVRSIPVYVIVGSVTWFCALESGVPPTLVGVAMGLLAPARHHHEDGASATITERLQTSLHPWSSFVILPVFALANAGVTVVGGAVGEALTSPVTIGVVLARTVGKAVGITGAIWLSVRFGIGKLPTGASWKHIVGMSIAAGAGFTVSLFVTDLAFGVSQAATDAKVGILVGTLVSAVGGYSVLKRCSPPQAVRPLSEPGLNPR